jgi:hypothetical protein
MPIVYKIKNLKSGQGSTVSCRAVDDDDDNNNNNNKISYIPSYDLMA